MEIAKLVLEYTKTLAWPATTIVMLLVFRTELCSLLGRLTKATLPGGTTLDFPREVLMAEALSAEVRKTPPPPNKTAGPAIPVTEANARLLNLGLSPSPSGLDFHYYAALAQRDPNLALAGLRMELEIMARNLAKGFNVGYSETDGAGKMLRRLREAGAITQQQAELGNAILRLCNAAVHGTNVTLEQADSVIGVANTLRDQFLNWLSWGFSDGWKAQATSGGTRV